MKRLIFILLVALGLQTQAQVMYCDSISYTTSSTINYPLILSGSSSMVPGTVTWDWTVCNTSMCYSDAGGNAYFGQVSTTDTLKVCYDATIDINGFTYVCTSCDSLVYNPNSYQWEIMQMIGSPTVIKEIKLSTNKDGKIYDLLGRELSSIPIGKMYIRNSRLCISK
tara:strand:+ start:102 stop:602 length:501 start_codon:yes stop_codon:yes gene_type:complete